MAITKPTTNMVNANLLDWPGNLPWSRISSQPAVSDLSGSLPNEKISGRKLSRVQVAQDTDFFYNMTENSLFRQKLFAPVAGVAFITWSADCSHRGIDAGGGIGTNYAIGIAGRLYLRSAASEAGLTGGFADVSTCTAGGQIYNRLQHYFTIGVARFPYAVLANTWYEFSLGFTAHTDAGSMNGADGAAELTVNGGTNFLEYEYEPGRVIDFIVTR